MRVAVADFRVHVFLRIRHFVHVAPAEIELGGQELFWARHHSSPFTGALETGINVLHWNTQMVKALFLAAKGKIWTVYQIA